MIKGVIFDLDGTLADTFEANAKAYEEAFKESGLSLSQEEYTQHFGKKWSDWGPRLAGKQADIVHRRKTELYFEMLNYVKPIMPVIKQFEKMKKECVVILMTDASPECAQKVIEKLNVQFHHEFYGCHFQNTKEMIQNIISTIKLKPNELVLIDDSIKRIELAKQLGLETQLVG